MTEAAFLSQILADPFDDAVRLVYADWLEDNGQPERATFVRDGRRRALRLTRRGAEFQLSDRALLDKALRLCPGFHLLPGPARHGGEARYVFRLGFVEEVALPLADFQLHAAVLFAWQPVRAVELTDRRPTVPFGGPGGYAYAVQVGDPLAAAGMPTLPFWEPGDPDQAPGVLPPWLFALLEGGTLDESPSDPLGFYPTLREAQAASDPLRYYPDVQAAQAALSDACVRYGRAAAKLPPVTPR